MRFHLQNITVVLVIAVIAPFYSFSQWTAMDSPTSLQISGVHFFNSQSGYIGTTEGHIFKTEDGGANWTEQTTGTTANIFAMTFIDEMTGFAATGDGTSEILRTVDGGEIWTIQTFPSAAYMFDIEFVNDSVGYACGSSGLILKTTDTGETWNSLPTGTTNDIRGMHMLNDTLGYAVADYDIIMKTINGNGWTHYDNGTGSILLDIHFTDENSGFAVGGSGTMVRSTDGGENWSGTDSDTNYFLQALRFSNPQVGFAVGGYGVISHTMDGGDTWSSSLEGDFSGNYGFYGLHINSGFTVAVGYEGNILYQGCPTVETTDIQMACDSLAWTDGNTYYENNNEATVLYSTIDGCDSLVTLDLSLEYSSYATDFVQACDEFTWIDGQTYSSSTDAPTYITINTVGCDSIVTLDLDLKYSTTSTQEIEACDDYTWIDGITYSSSNNTASWVLENSSGCDSTIYLDLDITEVNASILEIEDGLMATEDNAEYQWFLCSEPITIFDEATEQEFYPVGNGVYGVIVTQNGCSDTSECVDFTQLSITSPASLFNFQVFPNPAQDILNIRWDMMSESHEVASFRLLDVSGKILTQSSNFGTTNSLTIDTSDLSAGTYFIELASARQTLLRRRFIAVR